MMKRKRIRRIKFFPEKLWIEGEICKIAWTRMPKKEIYRFRYDLKRNFLSDTFGRALAKLALLRLIENTADPGNRVLLRTLEWLGLEPKDVIKGDC